MRRTQNSGLEPIDPALRRRRKETVSRLLKTNLRTGREPWGDVPLTHGAEDELLCSACRDRGPRTGWLPRQKFPVFWSWRPEVQTRGVSRVGSFVRANLCQGPLLASGGALPATFGGPWPVDVSPQSLPPCSRGVLLCVSVSRPPLFIYGRLS